MDYLRRSAANLNNSSFVPGAFAFGFFLIAMAGLLHAKLRLGELRSLLGLLRLVTEHRVDPEQIGRKKVFEWKEIKEKISSVRGRCNQQIWHYQTALMVVLPCTIAGLLLFLAKVASRTGSFLSDERFVLFAAVFLLVAGAAFVGLLIYDTSRVFLNTGLPPPRCDRCRRDAAVRP